MTAVTLSLHSCIKEEDHVTEGAHVTPDADRALAMPVLRMLPVFFKAAIITGRSLELAAPLREWSALASAAVDAEIKLPHRVGEGTVAGLPTAAPAVGALVLFTYTDD